MHWVEVMNDGAYAAAEKIYKLPAEGITQNDIERRAQGVNQSTYSYEFSLDTEHGRFAWQVYVTEYGNPSGATMLGFALTDYPSDVILLEPVMFQHRFVL